MQDLQVLRKFEMHLIDFKKSGKYVLAYGDIYDQREYYICSIANKIFINPQGMLNFLRTRSASGFH